MIFITTNGKSYGQKLFTKIVWICIRPSSFEVAWGWYAFWYYFLLFYTIFLLFTTLIADVFYFLYLFITLFSNSVCSMVYFLLRLCICVVVMARQSSPYPSRACSLTCKASGLTFTVFINICHFWHLKFFNFFFFCQIRKIISCTSSTSSKTLETFEPWRQLTNVCWYFQVI